MASGLLVSLIAAFQASLAVLLVIFYGALAVWMKLLDSPSAKMFSKVSLKIFLPALEFVKIGKQLHAGQGHRYNVILIWGCVTHTILFLIGAASHYLLGMPDWITATIMFNNTTSYPLLLIQALDQTGLLDTLITTGRGTDDDPIEQAKSYFLVYSVLSSCLTFAIGPRLMDTELPHEQPQDEDLLAALEQLEQEGDEEEAPDALVTHGLVSPNEHTSLLSPVFRRPSAISQRSTSFFPSRRESAALPVRDPIVYDRRPSLVSRGRWFGLSDRVRWWLLFFYDFLNAPLLGAIAGAIVGLSPTLHRWFFNQTVDGGIFTAWLTASLENVGVLFVSLPVVGAGVSLYTAMQKTQKDIKGKGKAIQGTPYLTTLFVLVVRLVVAPIVSTGAIYYLAKNTTWIGQDPILWFSMMFMPVGPSAVKLITMVEVSDASEEDQHKVAKLLAISYTISPVLAFAVVGSLRACEAALH
ncbi:membrane transporter protein [Rutstroemia sp. NJR-2017a WRK4]|nr:membrane transporter protein [Rutstroemia sp. NJR-2017a WRK4]